MRTRLQYKLGDVAMEDDVIKDKISDLINEMEESKLDRMLKILHSASDDSDIIDEKK
jgi:hypothetical protein